MTSAFRFRPGPLAGLWLVGLAFVGLSGCQSNKTIVARVNTASITNEEYEERVLRVNAEQLQSAPNMDAGGVALVGMIHETLVSELAKDKKVNPSEDDVQKVVAYTKHSDPRVASAISNGTLSEDDIVRSIRGQMEDFAIGTDGAKAEDKDVQALYNQKMAQAAAGRLELPETFSIKILRAPDLATGQQALDQLKKTGDWKGVASKVMHLSPAEVANAGKPQTIDVSRLQPKSLQDALRTIKPGEFAAAPIQAEITNSQTHVPEMLILVAQMISKTPARPLKIDEVRPLLAQSVIAKTHPDWQVHEQQLLATFTQDLLSKGLLQINIKRYEPLLDTFISPIAASHAGQVNGQTLSPQSAAPPAATPPGGSP